jgi:phage FluMu gp28-like protein
MRQLLSLKSMRRCAIDAGGMGLPLAEAAIEAFGDSRVEAVTFTPSVKDELATRLRLRVEEATIRIPVDEAIRNDWHSVRRCVSSFGPARYDAARSDRGHADRFWAACLAVRAAGAGGGAIEAVRGTPLKFVRRGIW